MAEKTLKEYLSNVRSELIRNAWHFSPDHAEKIVFRNIEHLQQDYLVSQKSSWTAAMELGFSEE